VPAGEIPPGEVRVSVFGPRRVGGSRHSVAASAARRGRPSGEFTQALAILPQLVLRRFHGGRERGSPSVIRHDAQHRPVPRGTAAQRGEQVRRQRLRVERAAVRRRLRIWLNSRRSNSSLTACSRQVTRATSVGCPGSGSTEVSGT